MAGDGPLNDMKTIAITGAAGLVGTGLRTELLALGYGLILLDVKPVPDLRPQERAFFVDVRDQAALTERLGGADAIVHLAACTTDAPWPDQVSLSIDGTISLFDAARAAGVNRVVYASSHHAVGFHSRARPIDDQVELRPDSRYGVGKAFGESIGALYACKHGFGVLAIRIGNVNTRPIDRRRLGNWLSWRDLGQLVAIGIEHPGIVFEIVYGISDATGRNYDNSNAHRLGYRPRDEVEPWLKQVLREDPPPAPGSPEAASPAELTLGGQFSAAEFEGSTERLKTMLA
jgi:uronate dehydrogenase